MANERMPEVVECLYQNESLGNRRDSRSHPIPKMHLQDIISAPTYQPSHQLARKPTDPPRLHYLPTPASRTLPPRSIRVIMTEAHCGVLAAVILKSESETEACYHHRRRRHHDVQHDYFHQSDQQLGAAKGRFPNSICTFRAGYRRHVNHCVV